MMSVVNEAYLSNGRWPIFQYVEAALYRQLGADAVEVLRGLPHVSIVPVGLGSYSWMWVRGVPTHPQPGDLVGLTVAGLHQLGEADVVHAFLDTLAYLVDREREVLTSPTDVVDVSLGGEEIRRAVPMPALRVDALDLVVELTQHEPSTWRCSIQPYDDGSWKMGLDPVIRRYRGVTTVGGYLSRLLAQLTGDGVRPVRPVIPQFSESLPNLSWTTAQSGRQFDFFICHASQDKEAIARPLFQELTKRGYRVWFDEAELRLGDSLVGSIDRGLSQCQYGIVILSPAFFSRAWPKYELSGLVQRSNSGAQERLILPVWHGIDHDYVQERSPSLADLFAVTSEEGEHAIVAEILRAIGAPDSAPISIPQVPGSVEEQRRLLQERGPYWEHFLYAGVLLQGQQALDPRWRDHELGLIPTPVVRLTNAEALGAVRQTRDQFEGLVDNVERLFSTDALNRAFGPPGDPERIIHLAQRLIDTYDGFLEGAAALRGYRVADSYGPLLQLAQQMADRPLAGIRQYISGFETWVRQILIRADCETNASPTAIPTLRMSMDGQLEADVARELGKFSRHVIVSDKPEQFEWEQLSPSASQQHSRRIGFLRLGQLIEELTPFAWRQGRLPQEQFDSEWRRSVALLRGELSGFGVDELPACHRLVARSRAVDEASTLAAARTEISEALEAMGSTGSA